MLPDPISLQLLDPKAWKGKRLQGYGSAQLVESPSRLGMQLPWECLSRRLRVVAVVNVFGASILERNDQVFPFPELTRRLTVHVKHNIALAS